MDFGMWDMVRVDHGTEWALVLYIQNLLSNHRNDPSLRPYLQTSSRQVGKLCSFYIFRGRVLIS